MLKFSTTTPFSPDDPAEKILSVRPLIVPPASSCLRTGKIRGKEARIVGKALIKAGFELPCFFDGDITELDNLEAEIIMVLPEGEYHIQPTLNDEGIYELDLKGENPGLTSNLFSESSCKFCFLILDASFGLNVDTGKEKDTGRKNRVQNLI